MPSSRLEGRKVLIFGGSSGLGYGTAEACIDNGMTVIISSFSQEKVNNAISRILKKYPSAKDRLSGHACNIGDQATLESNIVKLFEKVGKLDHIISSAGGSLANVTKPLDQIEMDSAVKTHMVQYFAPMIIGKHAKKYLSAGPHSSLTLTSGSITLRPRPDWVLASSILSALNGLAQSLALELAPIRVNVVQPGYIDTEIWDTMDKEELAAMRDAIRESLPTQRLAQPEDIAETYLYTLKDLNLTGSIIKADGGGALK